MTGWPPRITTDGALLAQAEAALLERLPRAVQLQLRQARACRSNGEVAAWHFETRYYLEETAVRLPRTDTYSSDRALCPLCEQGSTSLDGWFNSRPGWSLDRGLAMHLEGRPPRTPECPVLHFFRLLALEAVRQPALRVERERVLSPEITRLRTERLRRSLTFWERDELDARCAAQPAMDWGQIEQAVAEILAKRKTPRIRRKGRQGSRPPAADP